MNSPRVHLIILTWNHWEVTRRCLESLGQLTYPNLQIVIVDNASTDNTVANIQKQFPDVNLIRNKQNLGFAAGCNIGMRYALNDATDFIFLLNNDTTVTPNLIDMLVAAAGELPDAAILTPRIVRADDPNQLWFTASRRNPWTLEASDFGSHGARKHMQTNAVSEVDYVFGTAMLVTAVALKTVGGFDEQFFMYFEDMDWCLRFQAAGFKLYYVPQATLAHEISASTKQFSTTRAAYKAKSSAVFFRKHASGWRRGVILFMRLASLLKTIAILARHQQWDVIRAHLNGLYAGLSASVQQQGLNTNLLHDLHDTKNP